MPIVISTLDCLRGTSAMSAVLAFHGERSLLADTRFSTPRE